MPPSSVCAHIPQPSYIVLHLSPQIVFDFHVREFLGQFQNRRVLQRSDLLPRVDVEFRHDLL